jgi:transposase
MSNNAAERANRPIALGGKNLFTGSDAGGRRAAVISTRIKTAKLNVGGPQQFSFARGVRKQSWPSDRSFISRAWFHAPENRAGGGRARKRTYVAAE